MILFHRRCASPLRVVTSRNDSPPTVGVWWVLWHVVLMNFCGNICQLLILAMCFHPPRGSHQLWLHWYLRNGFVMTLNEQINTQIWVAPNDISMQATFLRQICSGMLAVSCVNSLSRQFPLHAQWATDGRYKCLQARVAEHCVSASLWLHCCDHRFPVSPTVAWLETQAWFQPPTSWNDSPFLCAASCWSAEPSYNQNGG